MSWVRKGAQPEDADLLGDRREARGAQRSRSGLDDRVTARLRDFR